MPEIKSRASKNAARVETIISKSLKKKFLSKCKKSNCSMNQRIRDLIQADVK